MIKIKETFFDTFRYYEGENILTLDKNLKEPDFAAPDRGKNVSYRIWNLKEKNKPASKGIKMLVRSKTHAVCVDRRFGMNPFQVINGTLLKINVGNFFYNKKVKI